VVEYEGGIYAVVRCDDIVDECTIHLYHRSYCNPTAKWFAILHVQRNLKLKCANIRINPTRSFRGKHWKSEFHSTMQSSVSFLFYV